jgi:hypothetical protein
MGIFGVSLLFSYIEFLSSNFGHFIDLLAPNADLESLTLV